MRVDASDGITNAVDVVGIVQHIGRQAYRVGKDDAVEHPQRFAVTDECAGSANTDAVGSIDFSTTTKRHQVGNLTFEHLREVGHTGNLKFAHVLTGDRTGEVAAVELLITCNHHALKHLCVAFHVDYHTVAGGQMNRLHADVGDLHAGFLRHGLVEIEFTVGIGNGHHLGAHNPYLRTDNGLFVLVEHIAAHFHRVDFRTGREAIGVVAQRVALVVIGDGIGEVDGIGDIRLQRVLQFHFDALTRRLDFRHLNLWRRYDDFLRWVINLDELVEEDAHLLRCDVRAAIFRRGSDDAWRRLIEPATIWISHTGTRRSSKVTKQQGNNIRCYLCHLPMFHIHSHVTLFFLHDVTKASKLVVLCYLVTLLLCYLVTLSPCHLATSAVHRCACVSWRGVESYADHPTCGEPSASR